MRRCQPQELRILHLPLKAELREALPQRRRLICQLLKVPPYLLAAAESRRRAYQLRERLRVDSLRRSAFKAVFLPQRLKHRSEPAKRFLAPVPVAQPLSDYLLHPAVKAALVLRVCHQFVPARLALLLLLRARHVLLPGVGSLYARFRSRRPGLFIHCLAHAVFFHRLCSSPLYDPPAVGIVKGCLSCSPVLAAAAFFLVCVKLRLLLARIASVPCARRRTAGVEQPVLSQKLIPDRVGLRL